jgi:glycosyltransferase involved in cell wall biosynthesis
VGLKILSRAKLIADFRDPWVTNPFASNSKGCILSKMEVICERTVVKIADRITLNTEELKTEFQQRYDFLPKDKFHTLINGYDSEDFKNIRFEESLNNSGKIIISHVGFLYGLRDPVVVFQALMKVRKQNPLLFSKIIFQQIGEINLHYDINTYVKKYNLETNFINLGQLSHKDALQQMAYSDILLTIQPKTTTQIPSKIYEYIFFNKPILSIGDINGALSKLIREYSFGRIFPENDVQGISDYLIEMALHKDEIKKNFKDNNNRKFFDIRNISKELWRIIDEM